MRAVLAYRVYDRWTWNRDIAWVPGEGWMTGIQMMQRGYRGTLIHNYSPFMVTNVT